MSGLVLEWKHINFKENTYTIVAEHNKIGIDQYYEIPIVIREALLEIKYTENSIVFALPLTRKELSSPRWQLEKIKKLTGIEELTMQYFRHILVSALGSAGVPGHWILQLKRSALI